MQIASNNRIECALFHGVVICVFLVLTGCTSYDPKTYSGEVVDEQDSPIQGVEIILCYTGWDWDWSMAGGFPLSMGIPHCSDAVLTDGQGRYRVEFAGPESTYIIARHKDWRQPRGFQADEGRVVLVRKDAYNQRAASQEAAKEREFRRRRSDESGVDYYCRVVRRRSGTVALDYHGQRIEVVQAILADRGNVIVGVTGAYEAVKALSGEVVILGRALQDSRASIDRFDVLPEKDRCADNMYVIRSSGYSDPALLEGGDSVWVEVPSIRASFKAQVWNSE